MVSYRHDDECSRDPQKVTPPPVLIDACICRDPFRVVRNALDFLSLTPIFRAPAPVPGAQSFFAVRFVPCVRQATETGRNCPAKTDKIPSEASDALTATDKVPSEASDTPTATDKLLSEVSDSLTAIDRILSETSDALTTTDKVLSEASDAPTATDKAPSEASDSLTAIDKVLSEASDALTAIDRILSEASDALTATDKAPSETSDTLTAPNGRGAAHLETTAAYAAAEQYNKGDSV